MGVLVFAMLPVMAQENLEDLDFAEMSLEDSLNVEVTVASKTEGTAADVSSAVTVFSRVEIQNMGITTMHALLNYVPGFRITRDTVNGIENAISARGSFSGNGNSVWFHKIRSFTVRPAVRLACPSLTRKTTLTAAANSSSL